MCGLYLYTLYTIYISEHCYFAVDLEFKLEVPLLCGGVDSGVVSGFLGFFTYVTLLFSPWWN